MKSPKILGSISKFILIIADLDKNNSLIMSMKQLPFEFFKSVAFFLGHPVFDLLLTDLEITIVLSFFRKFS